MQVSDEVVSVVLRQGHERPAHDDELHLVHTMTQLLQLQNALKVLYKLCSLVVIDTVYSLLITAHHAEGSERQSLTYSSCHS